MSQHWIAVIALGSNLGDRLANIEKAVQSLKSKVEIQAMSSLYETDAMYVTEQPKFLNGILMCRTDLPASELLTRLKEVERVIGRRARELNGPREIDLDIIHHSGGSSDDSIMIPHPRAHERRFVLEPLNEIAPDFCLPGYGVVHELLTEPTIQSQVVTRINHAAIQL